VAVVGSVFSSVYAAHLADGIMARLPGPLLASAEESVGAGAAIAASADLTPAFEQAFMAGLQVSCVLVGVVCLVGAVASAIALPGRVRTLEEHGRP
jgi:hypothetical protein